MLSRDDLNTSLAAEIIEDAERSRTSAEALVLKASRLARLVDDEEAITWLHYERFGYIGDNEIAVRYVGYTGRWVDADDHSQGAYWGSISYEEALLKTLEDQLEVVKNYRPSGE